MTELPRGWAQSTLGRCCLVTLGQSPPGSSYNEFGVGMPFFQGKAEFGDLWPKTRKWTTQPTKIALENDVLISVRAPVGPTNLAPCDCAIGRGLASLWPRGGIDSRYILYWLRASQRELASLGTGTTFAAISGAVLREHEIPLAPLAEQRRIVAAIEEHFSRLDAAEQALRVARRRLERMTTAVLTHALRHADRHIRLREVAEVRLGRQRSPKNHVGPNMRPYLRAANVTWKGLSLADVKSMHFSPSEVETYELREGDVLLAEASGSPDEVGKPAVWRGEIPGCCFQNTLIRVRSHAHLPEFLRLVFLRDALVGKFAAVAPGVGIHHLGASRLANWEVPLPEPGEQSRIIADVEQQLSLVDAMAAEIDRALKRSATLRRSILEQAFSGKLVPQDPSDEPASVLLERIRAERAAAETATGRRPRRRATMET